MGLTRLANTGIDRVTAKRAKALEDVLQYGTSELLCYRAGEPPDLVACQQAVWQPWLDWTAERHGARLKVGAGVAHIPQPPEALAALRLAVARASDLELAGLGSAVQALGSLVLGLALWQGAITPDSATDAALLDELYQAAKWGQDREAARRRAALRHDVADAHRFLTLLRDGG
jgi:chaperone required for assembly of F1-ATPase